MVFIWIIVGMVVGWLIATFIKHSTSNLIDIIFGLVGSFIGAFITNTIFGVPVASVYTYLAAACGAVIFVFLGRLRAISQ